MEGGQASESSQHKLILLSVEDCVSLESVSKSENKKMKS